jgi:subtilisin family serine protease
MNRTSRSLWARCTGLALLIALVAGLGAAPRAEAAAPPTTGAALLRLLPSASLSGVTNTLQRLGLRVQWVDPAARLLVVDAPGKLGSTVVSLVSSVSWLLGIQAVELNLGVGLGDGYEGKQSQAALCSDDLVAGSMRWQGPMDLVGANPAPANPKNAPVVAIVDGGFSRAHEALPSSAVASSFDAFDGDTDVEDLGDGVDGDRNGVTDSGVGHGTAVAALVLTAAPASRLVLVRALDDEGTGSFATLASGIDAALRRGAQVINISAGSTQSSSIVESLLKEAAGKGVLVACAAGNEAGTVIYPARSPYAFAVGGCGLDRTRDPYSNAGATVDLGAPSMEVVAPAARTTDGYAYWNGTSFATPIFAGCVAQVLSMEDGKGKDVAQRLLGCTQPWADGSKDLGKGVLDLRPLRRW